MQKSIRILQIIPNLKAGGAEKIVYQLLTNLDKNKFSSAVLLFKDDLENTSWKKNLSSKNVKVTSLSKQSLFDWHNFYQIIKAIKNYQPDIVHTHLGGDIYGVLAAKLAGAPIIISTEHNLNLTERKSATLLKKICAHLVNKIFAVSEAVRKDAIARYSLKPSKIAVIYNGVDLQEFTTEKRKEIDTKNKILTIGSLGRLNSQKGFSTLIEAVAKTTHKNYILEIGGEGELRPVLENQIKTLGLNNRIKLIGEVKASDFLKKIDVFILSSLWEGLGLVALEAGAALKPTIVSETDGLVEIIDESRGFLFTKGDSNDLANKIDYLINNLNTPEIAAKVEKNYLNIKNNFALEVMLKNYTRAYEDLYKKYEDTAS